MPQPWRSNELRQLRSVCLAQCPLIRPPCTIYRSSAVRGDTTRHGQWRSTQSTHDRPTPVPGLQRTRDLVTLHDGQSQRRSPFDPRIHASSLDQQSLHRLRRTADRSGGSGVRLSCANETLQFAAICECQPMCRPTVPVQNRSGITRSQCSADCRKQSLLDPNDPECTGTSAIIYAGFSSRAKRSLKRSAITASVVGQRPAPRPRIITCSLRLPVMVSEFHSACVWANG